MYYVEITNESSLWFICLRVLTNQQYVGYNLLQ